MDIALCVLALLNGRRGQGCNDSGKGGGSVAEVGPNSCWIGGFDTTTTVLGGVGGGAGCGRFWLGMLALVVSFCPPKVVGTQQPPWENVLGLLAI